MKRADDGEFASKAGGGGSAAPKTRRKSTAPALRSLSKEQRAKVKGTIDGSRTLIREQLTGDDPSSRAKRKAAEAMFDKISKRAKLEGISTSRMPESQYLALAKRAGLDPDSDAVIHATWLNSAGQGAGRALTNAERTAAKKPKPVKPDSRVMRKKKPS